MIIFTAKLIVNGANGSTIPGICVQLWLFALPERAATGLTDDGGKRLYNILWPKILK